MRLTLTKHANNQHKVKYLSLSQILEQTVRYYEPSNIQNLKPKFMMILLWSEDHLKLGVSCFYSKQLLAGGLT